MAKKGRVHYWSDKLTVKQATILKYCIDYFCIDQIMPSCKEVSLAFKNDKGKPISHMKSWRHLKNLEKKGYLKKRKKRDGWLINNVTIKPEAAIASFKLG